MGRGVEEGKRNENSFPWIVLMLIVQAFKCKAEHIVVRSRCFQFSIRFLCQIAILVLL